MPSLTEANKVKIAAAYCAPPFPTVQKVAELLKLSPRSIYSVASQDRDWWQSVKAERERAHLEWIHEHQANLEAQMVDLLPAAMESLKIHLSDPYIIREPGVAAEARRLLFKYLLSEPQKKLDVTSGNQVLQQQVTYDLSGFSTDELRDIVTRAAAGGDAAGASPTESD